MVISSDFDQVLRWAELNGHEIHERPPTLAGDEATISDMAADLAAALGWTGRRRRVPAHLPAALQRLDRQGRRGVPRLLTPTRWRPRVRERHLFWLDEEDDLAQARPLFESRVNRQYAKHRVLRETGSIQLVRAAALAEGGQMVTDRHVLFEVPADESLDIDTVEDLVVARRRLERGTVVFRVRANAAIGSGHVHHCLQLADELADQRVRFLLRDCDPFVGDLVTEHGYDYDTETDLAADLGRIADHGRKGPGQRRAGHDRGARCCCSGPLGFKVVNIEDLGPGAKAGRLGGQRALPHRPGRRRPGGLGPRVRDAAGRVLQPAGQDHPRPTRAAC